MVPAVVGREQSVEQWAFHAFPEALPRHLGTIEKMMGGLFILAGIAFLTGAMATFSYWLLETFPSLELVG